MQRSLDLKKQGPWRRRTSGHQNEWAPARPSKLNGKAKWVGVCSNEKRSLQLETRSCWRGLIGGLEEVSPEQSVPQPKQLLMQFQKQKQGRVTKRPRDPMQPDAADYRLQHLTSRPRWPLPNAKNHQKQNSAPRSLEGASRRCKPLSGASRHRSSKRRGPGRAKRLAPRWQQANLSTRRRGSGSSSWSAKRRIDGLQYSKLLRGDSREPRSAHPGGQQAEQPAHPGKPYGKHAHNTQHHAEQPRWGQQHGDRRTSKGGHWIRARRYRSSPPRTRRHEPNQISRTITILNPNDIRWQQLL